MLDKLTTEARNKATEDLDIMSTHEILVAMNNEDMTVPKMIKVELEIIEEVIDCAIQSLQKGGRIIYIGAGTSGRLGILDAAECVPTFSVSSDVVVGVIAGGEKAFTEAVEGAEDTENAGEQDLASINITKKDLVIGIAASGRTPYVIGGLTYANKVVGAKTASISCNKESLISNYADIAIEVDTGPEVLTGSTRLKAGTAQKMILNMISTASMVGIGKAYKNLMVDVQSTNLKLIERSKRIIMQAAEVDEQTAEKYYDRSNQNVKVAIIMILLNCSYSEATERLKSAKGYIRKAIKPYQPENG